MKYFLLLPTLLFSIHLFADVNCYKKDYFGKEPVKLRIYANLQKSLSGFKDKTCQMTRIPYNPKASKYEGWIRFNSDKQGCPAMGKEMFGESPTIKRPIAIHWFSISKEVQQNQQGFIQIGYENVNDPGAGGTSKVFLVCYPAS